MFRATRRLQTISDEYIPRAFPVKATTGLAGYVVEPLWKPKMMAATSELEAFLKASDIPEETTFYQCSMVLVRRVNHGLKMCGDDWVTLEKKYFWGWPVEFILNKVWTEIEQAKRWNEARLWEVDPEQLKKAAREDQHFGKHGPGFNLPFEQVVREDFDKRKKALTQEEIAELKRLDVEKMTRETAAYKERKDRIKDDLEKARGDMLKKFLNKRYNVDRDLMRMQPGQAHTDKTGDDLIRELKQSKGATPEIPK
jgi:hypothetical protein